MTDFASLKLAPQLLKALEQEGYQNPTPIQAQSIPFLMEGHDVLGLAQTGTGKTAAFALPILHYLANNPKRMAAKQMRVLVLAPTRELASQIEEGFATYGRHLPLKRAVIFGGVGQHPQVRALQGGLDVLVATPGRLIDLIQQGHASLSAVEILVLDEADRMLDMGFIHDVRKVAALVPKKRQTLLFSATMPDAVAQLAAGLLHAPKRVEVTPVSSTAERIDQKVMFVSKDNKRPALAALFDLPDMDRAIIFTRTKHGANRVAEFLTKKGIAADAIHGNKSQNARVRALDAFRTGQCRALVATDIAARGIDIDGISHVINYELPNEPESYVHRIGRTARAGRDGMAIALCDAEELAYLRDIEKLIQKQIETFADHGFHAESLARLYREGGAKYAKKTRQQRGRREDDGDGAHQRPRQQGRPAKQSGHSRPDFTHRPTTARQQGGDDSHWGEVVSTQPRKASASAFRSENRPATPPKAGENRFKGNSAQGAGKPANAGKPGGTGKPGGAGKPGGSQDRNRSNDRFAGPNNGPDRRNSDQTRRPSRPKAKQPA